MRGMTKECVATSFSGQTVAHLTLEPLFNPVMLKGGWPDEGCSILIHLTDKFGTLFGQFPPKELWETLKASKDESRRIVDGWPTDRFLVIRRSLMERTEIEMELAVGSENQRNEKLTYVQGEFKRRDLTKILRAMNKWFERNKSKALSEPDDEDNDSFTYEDAMRTNRATIETLKRIAREAGHAEE